MTTVHDLSNGDDAAAARRLAGLLAGATRPPLSRFSIIRPLMTEMIAAVRESSALPVSAGIRHAAQSFWWSPRWSAAGALASRTTTVTHPMSVGEHAGLRLDVSSEQTAENWFRADALLSDVSRPATAPDGYRPPRPRRSRRALGADGFVLDPDELERYAGLSGDHNPIHLSVTAAHAAGLPGPIHPGLFTFARAVSVACTVVGLDPDHLTHVSARFSHPVPVGSEVTVEACTTDDPHCFRLDATNAGTRVLRNAYLVFGGAPP
jgi:hypothetical protein